MGRSTLFPNGVSNAAGNGFAGLAGLPVLDPFRYFGIWDDFLRFTADQVWAADLTGTGAAAALQEVDGGQLRLTCGNVIGNTSQIQAGGAAGQATMAVVAGKELWFSATFTPADLANSVIRAGLMVVDTDVAVVTDGVYFETSGTDLTFVLEASSTETTLTGLATLANATEVEVAAHYNGREWDLYVDGALVATQAVVTNQPTAALTPTLAITAGAAANDTCDFDSILAVRQR